MPLTSCFFPEVLLNSGDDPLSFFFDELGGVWALDEDLERFEAPLFQGQLAVLARLVTVRQRGQRPRRPRLRARAVVALQQVYDWLVKFITGQIIICSDVQGGKNHNLIGYL